MGDAAGDAPSLLDELEVRFGRGGNEEPREVSSLSHLPGFARQAQAAVPEGGGSLVLSSPGLEALALPVPHLTGRISVVIVCREPDGQVEVHRYLHEAPPQNCFSDEIRVREQQWRALAQRTPITEEEALSLIQNEALDPLTIVIVGYRLWLARRLDLWFERSTEPG